MNADRIAAVRGLERARRVAGVLLVAGAGLLPLHERSIIAAEIEAPAPSAEREIALGRELFLHVWKSRDRLSPVGDGLGPLFNEKSCVACHNQGGVGGSGGAEFNALSLSVFRRCEIPSLSSAKDREQAALIHPALLENPGAAALHRFGVDKGYDRWLQERLWLVGATDSPCRPAFVAASRPIDRGSDGGFVFPVLGRQPSVLRRPLGGDRSGQPPRDLLSRLAAIVGERPTQPAASAAWNGRGRDLSDPIAMPLLGPSLKLVVSERNSIALFGAGIIDAIPDAALQREAARQALRGRSRPGEKRSRDEELKLPTGGRLALLDDGRIGRFGWKAQQASLEDFTLNACAVELGLTVAAHPQAADPLRSSADALGLDLDERQSESLVAYVRQLPAPRQARGRNTSAGEAVFDRIGCADCHLRDLGGAEGIFSDLLLHDMGSSLTGPIYAAGTRRGPQDGSTLPDPPADSEWRTPPLWGVFDSAPYLHDGRAATMTDAILEHGGQGARAAENFRSLDMLDNRSLLDFLGSLRAPAAAERTKARRPRASSIAPSNAGGLGRLSVNKIAVKKIAIDGNLGRIKIAPLANPLAGDLP